MLKIRLQRTGRINQPSYRIVVTEHARAAKTGAFVEQLGTYNPGTKARTLNEERIKYWLSVGAKASSTMHNMLVSLSIISGKKINVLPQKSPPKKPADANTVTELSTEARSKDAASAKEASSGGAKEEKAEDRGGEIKETPERKKEETVAGVQV